jgi:putative transposase
MFIQKFTKSAPRHSFWLETNMAEGFTNFGFPTKYRRFIRTTNSLEKINREICRRIRVVGIFPNETSCLRLISAILLEASEKNGKPEDNVALMKTRKLIYFGSFG